METVLASLAVDPRPVVFSVHSRTIDLLERYDLVETVKEGLTLADPVGYLDFVIAQAGAEIIVTNSGGTQKDVFFLNVPCVTLREETEWPETIEAGGNVLVGVDTDPIGEALANLPRSPSDVELYGDGNAASRIFRWVFQIVE